MARQHENYKELIWMLAKTDFKLRYHGSVLGYLWALLKPLLTFAILNFVFSSVFNPRGTGMDTYSLQLLVALMMFYFFAEGTSAGMNSLLSKSQLVTKIYVPRWTIILASTINATLIFLMNLVVIIFFFALKGFMPSLASIGMFLLFSIFIYIIVLSFALITAPLYVKFRDLSMIWEVLLMIIMYASPIIYPLATLPTQYHQFILLNPLAFIIHFTKESLINNHFASPIQYVVFVSIVLGAFAFSIWSYRKMAPRIAEDM
ncbi:MAG: ABC-2 type transporter [Candidatus Moranbacteria bacterium GW2011_GWA2_39_41]|nr:MAG: ABC-2 type transporter [Candidatus Moranbacteria bacterium GW2011_GWA2_39_41]